MARHASPAGASLRTLIVNWNQLRTLPDTISDLQVVEPYHGLGFRIPSVVSRWLNQLRTLPDTISSLQVVEPYHGSKMVWVLGLRA
jgi:hypothetical protein